MQEVGIIQYRHKTDKCMKIYGIYGSEEKFLEAMTDLKENGTIYPPEDLVIESYTAYVER